MLGLLTHEPHFCLLREEVRFGRKNQKRNASPSTVTFHLLHLTILREYIEHEFASLKVGMVTVCGVRIEGGFSVEADV